MVSVIPAHSGGARMVNGNSGALLDSSPINLVVSSPVGVGTVSMPVHSG